LHIATENRPQNHGDIKFSGGGHNSATTEKLSATRRQFIGVSSIFRNFSANFTKF
jgi:hypothetical protein